MNAGARLTNKKNDQLKQKISQCTEYQSSIIKHNIISYFCYLKGKYNLDVF